MHIKQLKAKLRRSVW